MLLQKISLLKLSELKRHECPDTPLYALRGFREVLKYKKPMNVYYDSLKINDENYTKSSENVA